MTYVNDGLADWPDDGEDVSDGWVEKRAQMNQDGPDLNLEIGGSS